MPSQLHQLPLNVGLKRRTTLEDFVAGQNASAFNALTNLLQGSDESLMFFWGRPGSGKSHLLLGACDQLTRARKIPAYLSLRQVQRLDTAMLEQLEQLDLVCLDDVDGVAGLPPWEEALFDLFNRLRASATPLLVAASLPPSELPLLLPDLQSRLAWGATFHLLPLSDDQRREVVIGGALRLGMKLTPQAADYLLRHYSRDLSQLFSFLDRLDIATLAAQRRPTIPFLQKLIRQGPAD